MIVLIRCILLNIYSLKKEREREDFEFHSVTCICLHCFVVIHGETRAVGIRHSICLRHAIVRSTYVHIYCKRYETQLFPDNYQLVQLINFHDWQQKRIEAIYQSMYI